jgi:hypothetical protein
MHLWRHPAGSAHERGALVPSINTVDRAGDSEVCYLHFPLFIQQNIARFKVAVNFSPLVNVHQAFEGRLHYHSDPFLLQTRFLGGLLQFFHCIPTRAFIHQLHCQVQLPLDCEGSVARDDVAVIIAFHDGHLLLDVIQVGVELVKVQDFDGYLLRILLARSAVDFPEGSPANLLVKAVAVVRVAQ